MEKRMKEKKEYRSAQRSRNLIRQAFMELLREKPFEKITVTDIVKRADINRSTFYAHYPDVMGVIEEIEEEIVDYSQNILDEVDFSNLFKDPTRYLSKIIELLEKNAELYRRLSQSNIAIKQMEKIKLIFVERIMYTSKMASTYEEYDKEGFYLRFFIGGTVDVCIQWINGEIDCSMSELTEKFAVLIKSYEDLIGRLGGNDT